MWHVPLICPLIICLDARPPSDIMMRLTRLSHDLIAMKSPLALDKLKLGQLMRVGESGHRAAVLCSRGGIMLAALTPDINESMLPDGAEASLIPGELLRAPLGGGGSPMGGRVVDCFGNALDGCGPTQAPDVALFSTPASQTELRPIDRSLHTGTLAIDALTPIGRGQSMMLFGEAGLGKTTLAWDACLAQADADVRCVIALADGGAERGQHALEQLGKRGLEGLRERCTIVAATGDSKAERMLMLAAAAAVSESIRDAGGHALLIADELRGMTELWDTAADAVATLGGPAAGAASDKLHNSEQRIFFASYLQRASQLTTKLGGGSLTMLGLLEQAAKPGLAISEGSAPITADSTAASTRIFTLDDFASRPATQQARVEALIARGIVVDEHILAKLSIDPPPPSVEGCTPSDPAIAEAREEHRRSVSHTDQLTSLADGHVQLQRALFESGRRPATLPSDSLARVGAGSDQSENRAQPATMAMKQVAQYLRLELAQARDLLPSDASDSPAVRQQRIRAKAVEAVLCNQPSSAPVRLSHQVVLLHCLMNGHLDHLAELPTAQAIQAAVGALLDHADKRMASELRAIDATGVLDVEGEQRLLACATEVLPATTGRRAFFTNWDPSTWQSAASNE